MDEPKAYYKQIAEGTLENGTKYLLSKVARMKYALKLEDKHGTWFLNFTCSKKELPQKMRFYLKDCC